MTSRYFQFFPLSLAGLTVVQRQPDEDERGFFCRFYCAGEFSTVGLHKPVAQMNHTFTRRKGSVRGLHFQCPPFAEAKIVNCLKGEIFDVAVDIRTNSPTFLAWHSEILSAANRKSLIVPEGFAHGFQALTDDCELIYLHTAAFAPEFEKGLNLRDSRLAIPWPLDFTDISRRDLDWRFIDESFKGIII